MTGESFLGALVGAFLAQAALGLSVRDELASLRRWAVDLSDHLHFKRPKRHTPQVDP